MPLQFYNTLERANELLQPWIASSLNPSSDRLDILLTAEQFLPAFTALNQARWGYLSTITGLDYPTLPETAITDPRWLHLYGENALSSDETTSLPGAIEVLYHIVSGPAIVTLRVLLDRTNPRLPTVCHLVPSATLLERELMEMFGVILEGTPNTDRLLLPDDWSPGVFPMRKDYIV